MDNGIAHPDHVADMTRQDWLSQTLDAGQFNKIGSIQLRQTHADNRKYMPANIQHHLQGDTEIVDAEFARINIDAAFLKRGKTATQPLEVRHRLVQSGAITLHPLLVNAPFRHGKPLVTPCCKITSADSHSNQNQQV